MGRIYQRYVHKSHSILVESYFPWILATDTNGAYLSHFTRWYWWYLMVTSRCSVTGGRVSGLIQLCPRWNNLGLVWGESGPELMLSGVDDTTNQTSVTIFLVLDPVYSKPRVTFLYVIASCGSEVVSNYWVAPTCVTFLRQYCGVLLGWHAEKTLLIVRGTMYVR